LTCRPWGLLPCSCCRTYSICTFNHTDYTWLCVC
jgi:hypothetical protein